MRVLVSRSSNDGQWSRPVRRGGGEWRSGEGDGMGVLTNVNSGGVRPNKWRRRHVRKEVLGRWVLVKR